MAGVVRLCGLPVSPATGQRHGVLPRGAVQIYEVALYLEVDSTAAELKRLRDAGFFAQARPPLRRPRRPPVPCQRAGRSSKAACPACHCTAAARPRRRASPRPG